jgi:hypothetical protein
MRRREFITLRQTDRPRRGDAFKPRSDIDSIAHQIAIALLNDIAEVDADAKLNAALGRKTGIAFDHSVLHLDGAANGVDDASKLNDAAIASALHHAAMMQGNGRGDQIAPERA